MIVVALLVLAPAMGLAMAVILALLSVGVEARERVGVGGIEIMCVHVGASTQVMR